MESHLVQRVRLDLRHKKSFGVLGTEDSEDWLRRSFMEGMNEKNSNNSRNEMSTEKINKLP